MPDLRLAEILAPLSRVTDLGVGAPADSAARTAILATALARHMHLPEREVADVYYTTLLQHIGCTAYSHETAAVAGGDDIALLAEGAKADDTSLLDTLILMLTGVARHQPLPARAWAVFNVIRAGPSFPQEMKRSICEVAVRTADRLGLPADVQRSLDSIHARWDGKGVPGISGDEIAPAARFAQVAGQAIVFHDLGGVDTALDTIRSRAGAAFDPAVADAFGLYGRALLAAINAADPALAVIDVEPAPHRTITNALFDDVARAFADITDLKSPWLHGHSTGVAHLADAAARGCGLPEDEITRIRRGGYLHDLGRVGVPSGIWDKRGPLTSSEWEQVRLHAYHTERILDRSPLLAELAPIAGMHHERLDGSGYHRGVSGDVIPMGARILAAADQWDAMTHDRPHRTARSAEDTTSELQADVAAGRLDPDAVHAVLQAAGQATPPVRHHWPAGLSDREVEVLRLAAHGRSNKEIGDTLSISPKTAGHHIQHIYNKIGVSTRAGAALFAMEHDLLRP